MYVRVHILNLNLIFMYSTIYYYLEHGLWTPGEEIAPTARLKIKSQCQISRYGRSIFCLHHRPNFSDFFDLCLHWVSVVCDLEHTALHLYRASLCLCLSLALTTFYEIHHVHITV